MTQVRLPDGSTRRFRGRAPPPRTSPRAIGPGLAKAAVAAKVNGEIVDLSRPLPDGADVALLTRKDPEALEVLRHSAAHLMADAILRLFPRAELTIGPVVEDGFYYDIHLPEGKITPDDFPRIEEEMARIAARGPPVPALRGEGSRPRRELRALSRDRRRAQQVQVGDRRRHPRARRRDLAVPPRRLRRSVPWPARAEHEVAREREAHQRRGLVLARRRFARAARARVRHGVLRQEGA